MRPQTHCIEREVDTGQDSVRPSTCMRLHANGWAQFGHLVS